MNKRKGRGAVSNHAGRFERFQTEPLPALEIESPIPEDEEIASSPATTVTPERTRNIITRNDSPDIPFDRSINPYKGCEHGCVYCFARPTHAYLGLSPGLDFETKIFSKPDAARLLIEELRRPGYRCEPMALGSNTDPYQPIEKRLRITRGILEVLADHRHPVTVVTKSHLVLRDLDILGSMARDGLVGVMLSVTTLDLHLARKMEPRASPPARRIATIARLGAAGVPVGVLASPMIPGLNDHEMERILEAAAGAGARWAGYILLRMPLEIKELFEEWLREHYPLRADHVLNLIRQTREGNLNQSEFGVRMRGTGPFAGLLKRRFDVACRRLGLDEEKSPLATGLFRVPPRPGDQGSLFV